jgi:hypothetical protein
MEGIFWVDTSWSGISGDKTEACQGAYDYWVVKLSYQWSYRVAKHHWRKQL